jgi:hypothetical protein
MLNAAILAMGGNAPPTVNDTQCHHVNYWGVTSG